MSKKATITTISKDLGISIGTISRILNGKGKEFRISDKTIALVLAHAKKTNYTPNLLAKSLRSSKTLMLGLILPDISNPFFAQLAKEIEHSAKLLKYSMVFVDSDENSSEEKKQLQILLDRKVDGIIIAPVGNRYNHFISAKELNVPMVMVDRYFPELDIPYIGTDNYAGAKAATNYLIHQGHRRIAIIKGNSNLITVKERLRGYSDALTDNKIAIDPHLIIGDDFSIANGMNSTFSLLDSKNPPSALFAMSNQLGLGVLEAARIRKFQIPQHVSLMVFDDQPYAAHIQPALSTIKQDIKLIGQLAVDGLVRLINNPKTPIESRLIEPTLHVRSSVQNIKN